MNILFIIIISIINVIYTFVTFSNNDTKKYLVQNLISFALLFLTILIILFDIDKLSVNDITGLQDILPTMINAVIAYFIIIITPITIKIIRINKNTKWYF